jgi:hypothetical protein
MSAVWQANCVRLMNAVGKISHHHHIIPRPAMLPAMKGNELGLVIHLEDVNVLARQAARCAQGIAPQMNEIAIEIDKATIGA